MFGKTKINDPYNTMGNPTRVKGCGRLVKKYDLSPDKPAPKTRKCPECKGERLVRRLTINRAKGRVGMGGDFYTTYVDCPKCQGRGEVPA